MFDVISCVEYDTGKEVLNKSGWSYKEYEEPDTIRQQLKKQEINLENAIKHKSIYGMNAEVYCCYAEAVKEFFVVRKDGQELEILLQIIKEKESKK